MKYDPMVNSKGLVYDEDMGRHRPIGKDEFDAAMKLILGYKRHLISELSTANEQISQVVPETGYVAIRNSNMSHRLMNVLSQNAVRLGISSDLRDPISKLAGLSLKKFSRFPQVGPKTLVEIYSVLQLNKIYIKDDR